MKNTLFDCGLLQKKTAGNKHKKHKSIPLDKYIILSEKEMIVCFLSDIAPFAEFPKRINNGRHKGEYTVEIDFDKFIHAEISNGIWQDTNNFEKVNDYMKELKCDFAKIDYSIPYSGIKYHHSFYCPKKVELTFRILDSFKDGIINEYGLNIEK